jgi:hypothetical protein
MQIQEDKIGIAFTQDGVQQYYVKYEFNGSLPEKTLKIVNAFFEHEEKDIYTYFQGNSYFVLVLDSDASFFLEDEASIRLEDLCGDINCHDALGVERVDLSKDVFKDRELPWEWKNIWARDLQKEMDKITDILELDPDDNFSEAPPVELYSGMVPFIFSNGNTALN